jgi:hypothetical protein
VRIFYRISDKSYHKGKLPGTTKQYCLENFLTCFPSAKIFLIADNCEDKTIEMCQRILQGRDHMVYETHNGNAGSLRWCLEMVPNLAADPESVVYFVEDDYLHDFQHFGLENELQAVLNQPEVSYATFYDHPDKYQSEYEGGEQTKVFRTRHWHWKFSISTTMTFAAKVKTIKEDLATWQKYTEGKHPQDHLCFQELNGMEHYLAVSIPGLACHTDLSYSESKGQCFIEDWVIQSIEEDLVEEVLGESFLWQDVNDFWSNLPPERSLQRLMMIEAMKGHWIPPSHAQFKT